MSHAHHRVFGFPHTRLKPQQRPSQNYTGIYRSQYKQTEEASAEIIHEPTTSLANPFQNTSIMHPDLRLPNKKLHEPYRDTSIMQRLKSTIPRDTETLSLFYQLARVVIDKRTQNSEPQQHGIIQKTDSHINQARYRPGPRTQIYDSP